jgi:hypothetical protein
MVWDSFPKTSTEVIPYLVVPSVAPSQSTQEHEPPEQMFLGIEAILLC